MCDEQDLARWAKGKLSRRAFGGSAVAALPNALLKDCASDIARLYPVVSDNCSIALLSKQKVKRRCVMLIPCFRWLYNG